MADFDRSDFELRYELFDKYALKDQLAYYERTVERSETAASQVNSIRAALALFTGLASAIAAVVAQAYLVGDCAANNSPQFCSAMNWIVIGSVIISILLPAVGAFFSSLADLYQWERLVTIYNSAQDNLEYADKLSPREQEDLETYVANLYAYVNGTLDIMQAETAQWGQAVQKPKQSEEFVKEAKLRAAKYSGDANAWQDIGFVSKEGDSTASSPADPPTTEI
ncbi:MAG: hypothetical protein AAF846_00685 [Chloroflexota bacterium]